MHVLCTGQSNRLCPSKDGQIAMTGNPASDVTSPTGMYMRLCVDRCVHVLRECI